MDLISNGEFKLALALTLFAGMATGIGSLIALLLRKPSFRTLGFLLGFSGGVMIYVSLVELLACSRAELIQLYGRFPGSLYAAAGFFGGIALAALIDRLIPEAENPHELQTPDTAVAPVHPDRLRRSGVLLALAIALHNLPEGMAVFVSGIEGASAGVPIALAIAIHNIPEGITVSVPIYQATGSRAKAFWFSAASGLTEPLGALVAAAVLMPVLSSTVLQLLFAGVAGIMVFLSVDELLPLAEKYGEHHWSIYGVISGMFVMAFSLAF